MKNLIKTLIAASLVIFCSNNGFSKTTTSPLNINYIFEGYILSDNAANTSNASQIINKLTIEPANPNGQGTNNFSETGFTVNIFSSRHDNAIIHIVSSDGMTYSKLAVQVIPGSNAINFSPGFLPSGSYKVQALVNGKMLNDNIVIGD